VTGTGSLALDPDEFAHHPRRARLALLAAAGHQQLGQHEETRRLVRLAHEWGCDRTLIERVLISGVYNTLGRANALAGRSAQALGHFEAAIQAGLPGGETRLLGPVRIRQQLESLGLGVSSNGQIRLVSLNALAARAAALKLELPRQPMKERSAAAKADYLNQNGEDLFKAGNYKLAAEYFQRALNLDPNNAWICQNLAEATARLPFKKGDQWEDPHFGERLDGSGKWDVTVRHYRRALQLDPAQVEAHRKAQTFAVEPVQADHIDNPVFIVGCGHSGTSLMLAILGNHPRLHPIPKESAMFLHTDAKIQQTFREWDCECRAECKARWAEKTPPHIFQIHRFLAFRPQARFILMVRDGRDVVCSLKFRRGYEGLDDRLDRWIYDNLAGQTYWRHPQVQVIKYEDLVTNTEATLHDLCHFLGEDYSPYMLDYHKTERRWYSDRIEKPAAIKTPTDHITNRNWQINQPIFDGRGRWQAEMTEADKARFKQSPAQRLLETLGYVSDSNW
jgi:tetratricopeptide (TPR) repeat protein